MNPENLQDDLSLPALPMLCSPSIIDLFAWERQRIMYLDFLSEVRIPQLLNDGLGVERVVLLCHV